MSVRKIIRTVYKEGGFDPSKPKNNVLETIEDNIEFNPIDKVKFLLELSDRGLFKTIKNDMNKLTEREIIIFQNTEKVSISDPLVVKVKKILKITDAVLEDIFIKAERQVI